MCHDGEADVASRVQDVQPMCHSFISIRGQELFYCPKHLQSGSEAYPVYYSMVTMWGFLPGSKVAEASS